MVSHDPETVTQALRERLCAVAVGPYRVEFINNTAPRPWRDGEDMALVERDGGDADGGVRDVITLSDPWFRSIIRHYGAEGVAERY